MQSLQDAAGRLYLCEQEYRQCGNRQQFRGCLQPFRREDINVEERKNRFGQNAHADRAGKSDQGRIADPRVCPLRDALFVVQRLGIRDCRYKAHGDCQRQRRGDIDQPDDHSGKDSVQRGGVVRCKSRAHHPVHHQGGIDKLRQGNDTGAYGNRNSDRDQPFRQELCRCVSFSGSSPALFPPDIAVQDHIRKSQHFNDRNPQQSACRTFRHALFHSGCRQRK